MKLQAAVLTEHNQPLHFMNLISAGLEPGQVLVRVQASGICGAQLNEITGVKGQDRHLPHLLGHEGAGWVIDIGPGVRQVKVGDAVVMHWRKGAGIDAEPPKYLTETEGDAVGGGWVTTFNTRAVVSENRLTKIEPGVPVEIAALMGCAVTTGLGLITNEARVRIGESVAVFGAGGVGLNCIQGASLVAAHPIVAVDVNEQKLEQAREFGATHAVLAKTVMNDDGVFWPELPRPDVCIDTTGQPRVIEAAFDILAPGGRLWLVGQVRHDQYIRVQTLAMHAGKKIAVSDGGGTQPNQDIPRYLRLWKAGKLKLAELITHRCALDELNPMLDRIRAGEVGRAVILMEQG